MSKWVNGEELVKELGSAKAVAEKYAGAPLKFAGEITTLVGFILPDFLVRSARPSDSSGVHCNAQYTVSPAPVHTNWAAGSFYQVDVEAKDSDSRVLAAAVKECSASKPTPYLKLEAHWGSQSKQLILEGPMDDIEFKHTVLDGVETITLVAKIKHP